MVHPLTNCLPHYHIAREHNTELSFVCVCLRVGRGAGGAGVIGCTCSSLLCVSEFVWNSPLSSIMISSVGKITICTCQGEIITLIYGAGQQQECLHNASSKCPHHQQGHMLLSASSVSFFSPEKPIVVFFICSIFTFLKTLQPACRFFLLRIMWTVHFDENSVARCLGQDKLRLILVGKGRACGVFKEVDVVEKVARNPALQLCLQA